MKAIRVTEYGGPAVLKLQETPLPQPGPHQVLVRNHAVGINPVDTYLRSGIHARKPSLPYTPGSDGAGKDGSTDAGRGAPPCGNACSSKRRSSRSSGVSGTETSSTGAPRTARRSDRLSSPGSRGGVVGFCGFAGEAATAAPPVTTTATDASMSNRR